MPGKKKGGGRRKNNIVKTRRLEDITKDFDTSTFEVYGQVQKAAGNRRFAVAIQDLHNPSELKGTINCSIKGSYRRRITVDQYVLVKLYDFNNEQGQIIDSYSNDEVQSLKIAEMWDFPNTTIDERDRSDTRDMLDLDSGSDSDSDPDLEPAPKSKPKPSSTSPQARDVDLDLDMDDFNIDAI